MKIPKMQTSFLKKSKDEVVATTLLIENLGGLKR